MSKFGDAMRGLTVFISDIRNCKSLHVHVHTCIQYICTSTCIIYILLFFKGKSKEAERKRINKELANIRSKFKSKCSFLISRTCTCTCTLPR